MFSLGHKPVVWMVTCSAIHITMLETLIGQCRRSDNERPLSRLTKLVKFNRTYHRLTCAYYIVAVVKYTLIWLLSIEWLHDYRLLDCLLVGRFNFIGRTLKVGRIICPAVSVILFAYRTRVAMLRPDYFKFYGAEFLLYDYNDILVNEIEASDRDLVAATGRAHGAHHGEQQQQLEAEAEADNPNTSRRFRMANCRETIAGNHTKASEAVTPAATRYEFLQGHEQLLASLRHSPGPLNGNFYLRNPFSNGQAEDEYILRLNRTSESWLTLAKYANFTFYCSIVFALPFAGLIGTVISGSLVTKIGFELNYPTCVRWLREQQNRTSSSYTFIYTVNTTRRLANEWHIDSLPFMIPLDDAFQGVTVYRLLAIAYDTLESHFWYLTVIFLFLGFAFNSYLITLDLLINARAIKSRLEIIIARFHQQAHLSGYDKYRSSNLELGQKIPGERQLSPARQRRIVHQDQYCALRALHAKKVYDSTGGSEVEISHIQAILLDHFNMTRDYNSYTSFFLLFCACGWSSYTISMCFWMGIVRSKSIEFEFAWAEAVTSTFFIILLIGPALLRTSNYRLYALITDAMALDDNLLVSKERWSMIIQYFYPKPMFCFTLFSSIELSWLFCLKLTSWIISAILVLANFFYMYKH